MIYNNVGYDTMTILMRIHHRHATPKTAGGTILFFLSALCIILAFKSDIIDKAVSNKALASALKISLVIASILLLIGSIKFR
ncbi:MAG TPA: hypothetical protein RWO09_00620 [Ruminococcus sp.]